MRAAIINSSSSKYSFAMSGCGWLSPFHFGAVEALKENQYLTNKSIVAGTSGGALAALLACSDLHPRDGLEIIVELSKSSPFRSRINTSLRRTLSMILTENAFQNSNGRLHIVVTKAWPKPEIKPKIISEFDSPEDMIDCIIASCFIPFYTDRLLTTTFRNEQYVDGGFLAFMPPIGNVRISPFLHSPIIRKADISPRLLKNFKFSSPRLLPWVLKPASPDVLRYLYEAGFEAASIWCHQESLKGKSIM